MYDCNPDFIMDKSTNQMFLLFPWFLSNLNQSFDMLFRVFFYLFAHISDSHEVLNLLYIFMSIPNFPVFLHNLVHNFYRLIDNAKTKLNSDTVSF